MNQNKILPRDQIAERDKWRITDLFATDEHFSRALKEAEGFLPKIRAMEHTALQSGRGLYDYLALRDEMGEALNPIMHYAARRSDEDTRLSRYQQMSAKTSRLATELSQAGAFFTPALLALSDETVEAYFAEEPRLAPYRLLIDRVRARRAHILSDKEEALLAATGEMAQGPDEIFSMLNDADLSFADAIDSEGGAHTVTHGTYVPLMQSRDRELRRSAFAAMYDKFTAFRNTAAATLTAQLNTLHFYSKVRHYDSTLDAALDGSEIPTEIYHNLIAAVHQNMAPMHRYVAMRKRLLGLSELHMYDLYVPIVEGADMRFTFDEAKALTRKALSPLGEDYGALLDRAFSEGWIDIYENEGKRSGAYSAGALVHPYILLNFKGRLDDVFTLVHELGHAIHSYLSNKTQPPCYRSYEIFVAEVASTCNEALLTEYLLQTTEDKTQKAHILNHFLEQFRATLYRQTMFAEFELWMNRQVQSGEGTTAEQLCAAYGKLNTVYYGKDIVVDEAISVEWARIPHFYYDYYVYQYATGYAAAIALSTRMLREGQRAVEDYLTFLSGGNSKDPIALLRGAGVDMAGTAPIEAATRLFDEKIDELSALLGH